ncbi:MAG: hypothetical protein ACI3ZS_03105 [Candidatus Cryptobacteroides sp.]
MLETVRQQVVRMIAAFESEKKERERLHDELEQSKLLNETYRKRISELERQIDNFKLKEAFVASGADNSEARKKIDSIIKEIDRCITLMEG